MNTTWSLPAEEKQPLYKSVSFLLLSTSVCLTVCAFLLTEHVRAVTHVRANTMPLLNQVPALERRIAVLLEQLELSELNAALKVGSVSEQVNSYVMPESVDLSRVVSVIDTLREVWLDQGWIGELSEVTLGSHEVGELDRQHFSLSFSAAEDHLGETLDFFQYAGLITVSDAISAKQRDHLLIACEEESPAAITALEQFLSTDLLTYVRDPRAQRDMLLRSFGDGPFAILLRETIQSSALPAMQEILGGRTGSALTERSLWPIPYLKLEDTVITKGAAPGWVRVDLSLSALGLK